MFLGLGTVRDDAFHGEMGRGARRLRSMEDSGALSLPPRSEERARRRYTGGCERGLRQEFIGKAYTLDNRGGKLNG